MSLEKLKGSLKSDKNDVTSHEHLCTVMLLSRSFLLRMIHISYKFEDIIKTHILCSKLFSGIDNTRWFKYDRD